MKTDNLDTSITWFYKWKHWPQIMCLTYLVWVVQKDLRLACLMVEMKAGMRVQTKAARTANQRY